MMRFNRALNRWVGSFTTKSGGFYDVSVAPATMREAMKVDATEAKRVVNWLDSAGEPGVKVVTAEGEFFSDPARGPKRQKHKRASGPVQSTRSAAQEIEAKEREVEEMQRQGKVVMRKIEPQEPRPKRLWRADG